MEVGVWIFEGVLVWFLVFDHSIKAKGRSGRDLELAPKGSQDISPCRMTPEDVYLTGF